MNVILLEKVRNLGNLGDTVHVKPGYARNYLIPGHKAVFATEENKAAFKAKFAELEKKAEAALAQAQQRAAILNDVTLVLEAQASEEGKLYGSVGISDIKDGLTAREIKVSKREIVLPSGPIYAVGHYTVEVHLHSDVVASLQVEVVGKK